MKARIHCARFQRAAALLVCAAGASSAAERLPALHADATQSSVSGISSGGYMAVQFHVAYSAQLRGAGVVAGGPFYCAKDSAAMAVNNCMHPGRTDPVPPVDKLVSYTESLEHAGSIDPTMHLRGERVWLFSGRRDRTVDQSVMDALRSYYLHFMPASHIVYENSLDAGHAFPTRDYGGACSFTGPPYIDNCGLDAAGAILQQIYGTLAARAEAAQGKLIEFDQREFLGGDAYAHSMRDSGFAYIPPACAQASCRVHVAFHGCAQNVDAVGDAFLRHAGYNEWADANALIILYPQTIARNGIGWRFWDWPFVFNPQGCWDWWGYDSEHYYQKDGPQMLAVKRMIERLAAPS
ncbi:MAG: polyhydroxybutyrate depolymerase [Pseudomonadota bacterium]